MQVQGELHKSKGSAAVAAGTKPYKNALQAFYVIGRNEGWRGLQGGGLSADCEPISLRSIDSPACAHSLLVSISLRTA